MDSDIIEIALFACSKCTISVRWCIRIIRICGIFGQASYKRYSPLLRFTQISFVFFSWCISEINLQHHVIFFLFLSCDILTTIEKTPGYIMYLLHAKKWHFWFPLQKSLKNYLLMLSLVWEICSIHTEEIIHRISAQMRYT